MLNLEFVHKGKVVRAKTDRISIYLPDGRIIPIRGPMKSWIKSQFPDSHSIRLIP